MIEPSPKNGEVLLSRRLKKFDSHKVLVPYKYSGTEIAFATVLLLQSSITIIYHLYKLRERVHRPNNASASITTAV